MEQQHLRIGGGSESTSPPPQCLLQVGICFSLMTENSVSPLTVTFLSAVPVSPSQSLPGSQQPQPAKHTALRGLQGLS